MTDLSDRDLGGFRSFVAEGLGFQVEDDALAPLADMLRDRLRKSACGTVDAYLDRLRDPKTRQEELRDIAKRLTIGETYFYRIPEQFRALADVALPDRLKARLGERPVRILSAGCATGEEAYTMALVLRETMPELAARDVEIVGIDVNPSFIERAKQAQFSPWSLRILEPSLRDRYFREENRSFHLDSAIRSMVTFEERNLLGGDDDWPSASFDIIFCRNVLIYFAPEAIRTVISRLAKALTPGGYLFLGPVETLRGISKAFHLLHTQSTFYYQLKQDGDAASSPATTLQPSSPANDTWVESVRRASDRIARLTSQGKRDDVLPALHAWDLSPAMELFKQERFTEAMASVRALPPDSLRDPDVLLLLAAILTNAGEREEAERVCVDILALDEFSAGAHYLMALCQEHGGETMAAQRHFETATYLDPAFAMPRLHLGLLAKRRGQLPKARRELERAQALLSREDASRMLLFGGGFNREALIGLCSAEIRRCGEAL